MPSMIVNFLNIDRYLKIFEFSFVKLLTSSKLNRNCFMKNEVPLNAEMVNIQRKSAGINIQKFQFSSKVRNSPTTNVRHIFQTQIFSVDEPFSWGVAR